jgi:CHAD domain-containing protein
VSIQSQALERELKLEPPPDFELPPLAGEPLELRVFTSTYHDTPSRSLARAGVTLRCRVENGESIWQLKLPREDGRAEIAVAAGPAGPPPELRSLLVAHLRNGDLEPVAALRTSRSGVRVGGSDRAVADVTIDKVEVLDGGKSLRGFVELEIELVDGDPADLEKLAKTLRKAGAKRSDGRAKVMRVLELPNVNPPGAGASPVARIRSLLAAQLQELERYDPGVRLGGDAEDLHKFRVATRRSRAVIRATKPLLGESLSDLGAELKWLASVLGPVRDLDVLIERLRATAETLDHDSDAASAIVASLEEERRNRYDALRQALDDDRYLALLDSFAAVAALPDLGAPDALRPLAAKPLRKLRKAAGKLSEEPTDEELHKLRIRAKRARYAAELVTDGRRHLNRYVDSLKQLQDVLGEHQDAVVAERQVRGLAADATALAAGRLIELERQRRLERRSQYRRVLARALRRAQKAKIS